MAVRAVWTVHLSRGAAFWRIKLRSRPLTQFLFPGKMTCLQYSRKLAFFFPLSSSMRSGDLSVGFCLDCSTTCLASFADINMLQILSLTFKGSEADGRLNWNIFSSFFWSETCGDLPRPAWDMFLQVEGGASPCSALPQWVVIITMIMIIVMVVKMMWWVTDGVGLRYQRMGVFLVIYFFVCPYPFNWQKCTY